MQYPGSNAEFTYLKQMNTTAQFLNNKHGFKFCQKMHIIKYNTDLDKRHQSVQLRPHINQPFIRLAFMFELLFKVWLLLSSLEE